MSLEQNKALVRRFVEELQCKHNLALVDEIFSPDFVDHSGISTPPDREGARAAFVRLLDAFPDHHFTVRLQLAEGDKVMTYKVLRGTHLGPFMGIAATGKPVTFEIIDIVTVVNGKIIEHWAVADTFGVLQQLDAVPGR